MEGDNKGTLLARYQFSGLPGSTVRVAPRCSNNCFLKLGAALATPAQAQRRAAATTIFIRSPPLADHTLTRNINTADETELCFHFTLYISSFHVCARWPAVGSSDWLDGRCEFASTFCSTQTYHANLLPAFRQRDFQRLVSSAV